MAFQLGDTVKWNSQAGGVRTTKQGTVWAVVPICGILKKVLKPWMESSYWKNYQPMFDFSGAPRLIESYVICVPSTGKAKPKLYWPRVSELVLVKKYEERE